MRSLGHMAVSSPSWERLPSLGKPGCVIPKDLRCPTVNDLHKVMRLRGRPWSSSCPASTFSAHCGPIKIEHPWGPGTAGRGRRSASAHSSPCALHLHTGPELSPSCTCHGSHLDLPHPRTALRLGQGGPVCVCVAFMCLLALSGI